MALGSVDSISWIDGLLLGVYKYRSMGGSLYLPLTSDIEDNKTVINTQNTWITISLWHGATNL